MSSLQAADFVDSDNEPPLGWPFPLAHSDLGGRPHEPAALLDATAFDHLPGERS